MKFSQHSIEAMLLLNEQMWPRFVCQSLKESYPISPLHELDDDDQNLKARDWCDRARANDLCRSDEILSFVFLMHEFAPNFDQHPYVRTILDYSEEPIGQRWERLFDSHDEALERAWQEIALADACTIGDWDVENYDCIEAAFPNTYRDPRFARYFREVKARHEG